MFWTRVKWNGMSGKPAIRPWLRHVVVHLPVLIAHRRRRGSRVVEEEIAGRLFRSPGQVVDLIDAIERGLDNARILSGLKLLLEPFALRAAGDLDEGWQPVERGEQLVLHRARPNDARPADHCRGAVAAFPGLAFLALEWGHATVREADRLGAVVGGEDDDSVVGLAHVVDFLQHEANVIVHL